MTPTMTLTPSLAKTCLRCYTLHLSAYGNQLTSVVFLADDGNWNPVEWERAAEELTWERVR